MIKIRHLVYLSFFLACGIGVISILPGKIFYKPEIPPVNKVEYYITTSVDSVKFEAEIRAKIMAELKPQIKTVIKTEKVNVDSLFEEAKNQLRDEVDGDFGLFNYIADFDTSFSIKDSLDKVTDQVSIHGQYVSPIPLHASSSFRLFFDHKSYTTTIHKEETIIEKIPTKFGFGIQASGGYELTKGKFGLMVGIGVHYQIKTLLPFGWIERLGHGFHITAGFDPVLETYGVTAGYGVHLDIFGG